MKVKTTFPKHGVEGDIVVYDQNGQQLDVVVGHIEYEPYFFSRKGQPVIGHIEVLNKDGDVIGKYAQTISGTTAGLALLNRTKRTVPLFEAESGEEPVVEEGGETADPQPPSDDPDDIALPFSDPAPPKGKITRRPAPGEHNL